MNNSQTTPKKVKKSYANCPRIQLVVRDKQGWRMYKQHPRTGKLTIESKTKPCTDADITFSDDGKYFAVLLEEGIEIYDSFDGRMITFLKHYRVRNIYFSPLNNFIVSYHHRRQDDKHGNCWVWKWSHDNISPKNTNAKPNDDESKQNDTQSKDIRVVYQFFLPEFNKKTKPLSFTNNEILAARITKDAVLIHDVRRLHYRSNNIIGKLDIPKVSLVLMAPTDSDITKVNDCYLFAAFALPKNNKAATVSIYEFQYNLVMKSKKTQNTNQKVSEKVFSKLCQRAFYNVDQCELSWDKGKSPYHHSLLATASSDVDTSGKSYYGNQTLFLLNSKQSLAVKIPIANKGKLQDARWHPYGFEFVMIDDHPQKITIFDNKGREAQSLGQHARNMIRFSKDGRFLWCGGFGNLTGEMSFYDWKNNRKLLGYNKDGACRYFEWSPDSSTLLAARLYPYMTVDNGFTIYRYNGTKLMEEKFERLYQVAYRPSAKGVYPHRSPSPNSKGPVMLKPSKQKRYVPPHMRRKGGSASNNNNAAQGRNNKKNNRKKNANNNNKNLNSNKENSTPVKPVAAPVVSGVHTAAVIEGFMNNNNNNNNDNDANDVPKKKKKRRKRHKKPKNPAVDGGGPPGGGGGNNVNNVNNNGNNGNTGNAAKPGLAENDNQRWARGRNFNGQ